MGTLGAISRGFGVIFGRFVAILGCFEGVLGVLSKGFRYKRCPHIDKTGVNAPVYFDFLRPESVTLWSPCK